MTRRRLGVVTAVTAGWVVGPRESRGGRGESGGEGQGPGKMDGADDAMRL